MLYYNQNAYVNIQAHNKKFSILVSEFKVTLKFIHIHHQLPGQFQ